MSRETERPSGDVHLANEEAILGLGAFGALATLPAAPVVAGAIVIGLGVYAASKAYDHFRAPDIQPRSPATTITPIMPDEEFPADDEADSRRNSKEGREKGRGQEPDNEPPPEPPASYEHRKRKSGLTGKEAAKDIPGWARQMGAKPRGSEDGKTAAERNMDERYGKGNWNGRGSKSEFNQLKKYFDRAFE